MRVRVIKKVSLLLCVFALVLGAIPAQTFAGTVADQKTNESIISAAEAIHGEARDDMNGVISVSNEEELKAAISPAGGGLHTQLVYEIPGNERTFTIELTADVDITKTLTIPEGDYITIIGGHALKMMNDGPTIKVPSDSYLTIAGITVTHTSGAFGLGVVTRGVFNLVSGSISNNNRRPDTPYAGSGGGVSNDGIFTMSGGSIAYNISRSGGGVYNTGTFHMIGGDISHNEADRYGMGGGVYNAGTFNISAGAINGNYSNMYGGGIYNDIFGTWADVPAQSQGYSNIVTMSGGEISDNQAKAMGGGVFNGGGFVISGGTISDNQAEVEGGGAINFGRLSLEGGTISDNNSNQGGGVFNVNAFAMSGGSVSDNTANTSGGGIVAFSADSLFSGGEISGNKAQNGGGIYLYKGCTVSNVQISNNAAIEDGGGIWVNQAKLDKLSIASDVMFSDNSAHTPYGRKPEDDGVYMDNIKCTAWTSPFPQGYNNYDISYEGVPFKETVDTDGPVISGFIPFVTEVKAGGEVHFEIDIKDPSGLGQPQALLIPPAGSSIAPLTATLTKSTGNTFSGLWNIPANAPAGQWQVRFECADTLGNFTTWNPTPVIAVAGAGASGGTQSQGVTLTLDRAALTLDIGGTATLKATQKRGAVINSYPNLDWTFDRSDVATVDVYGKVTAKGPGTAIIRVVGDEGATAICTVTVNAPAAEKGGGNIPDTPTGNGTTPGTSGGTDETTTSPGGNQTNGSTATATIPRIALKTVKAGKGKVTVTWKKASAAAKVTGYQIQVRVKGDVKWKTKTINAKKTSAAFTKRKTEKRYQVRIRAYRLADGKTHYGGWSKVFVSGKVR